MPSTIPITLALFAVPATPPELSRAELITTDRSSWLYAYDRDDQVAAEIVISADGLQASFDGLFFEVLVAPDRTVTVECGGEPCNESDLSKARTRLEAIGELLSSSPPAELDLRCAFTVLATGAACAGSAGGFCGIGFYLAACECMDVVIVGGKDICEEIELW